MAAGLAATMATLLLVARNGLAPLQGPLTFGLVFWACFLALYLALALPLALGVWLLASLTHLARLPRIVLPLATLGFLGAALASNRDALPLLLALDGPARFRWLVPCALALCVLGLLALAWAPRERPAAHRLLAALSAATGLVSLVPASSAPAIAALPAAVARPTGERLLVVGVDGADWDYMEPLIARGELPNLAALRQRGAWGRLETLRPTISPTIWTSIVTGRTPRDHGVKEFVSLRLRGVEQTLPHLRRVSMVGFPALFDGLGKARLVYDTVITSTTRRVPAFWNIASASGSPVNVVSWWATWPAEPVLGSIVSEPIYYWPPKPDGSLPRTDRLTSPESLYREIARHVMRPREMAFEQARLFMDVPPGEFRSILAREGTGIDRELTYYFSYFETTRRIALDLIERGRARYGVPPDTLVLFRIVDKTCHTSLADSELIRDRLEVPAERLKRYGRVVTGAYRVVDAALGELMSAFGDGSVVVVSDHGFRAHRHKGRPVANHKLAPEGIFIAAGAPFRPGRVDDLNIYDILPLLLYVKGLPIADDLVEPLDERLIASGFRASHPGRRVASYGSARRAVEAAPEADSEVDAEALEHLRALGYIK